MKKLQSLTLVNAVIGKPEAVVAADVLVKQANCWEIILEQWAAARNVVVEGDIELRHPLQKVSADVDPDFISYFAHEISEKEVFEIITLSQRFRAMLLINSQRFLGKREKFHLGPPIIKNEVFTLESFGHEEEGLLSFERDAYSFMDTHLSKLLEN
jgi:hypothetical protein